MIRISITQLKGLAREFRFFGALRDRLSDITPGLVKAGAVVADAAKAHIIGHASNDAAFGVPWAMRKYPWESGSDGLRYYADKHRGSKRTPWNTPHPPLRWNSTMLNSFTVSAVEPGRVRIGTDVLSKDGAPYPKFLQEGTRHMPGREFLTAGQYGSDNVGERVRQAFAAWLFSGKV